MVRETTTEVHHHKETFLTRYIFSMDHKVIAIQYLITALAMGFIGLFLSWLMRIQLGWSGRQFPFLSRLFPGGVEEGIIKPEFYLAMVTMHGTIMIFFFITAALVGGFGNFLIPLQIGARDMAFPFLNMLSYWVFLASCIVLVVSFFVTGGPAAAGWTAYPPLSGVAEAIPGSGLGQTLWLLSLALFIASSLFGSLNYITTTLNLRTKGLSMGRLPLTVWALFITAILGLLSFPVLLAAAIMLLFDRHLGTSFFLPRLFIAGHQAGGEGGNPILWQHLFWFLGHPEVYIAILPAMGITSEVLATCCRKPIFGYKAMVLSLLAIAFLSFIVWGHHMFVSGMNPLLGTAFMTTTLLIAVPSAVKTFNWLATIWGGNIKFTAAALFAIGFVSVFTTGGLTGIFLGNPPVDIQLHDTYFVVAHFHFVMGTAAVFGIFAGIYHWFPKMFGRMMNEPLAKAHFWLTFIGVYLIFFPMHYLGISGVPRRFYDFANYDFIPPSVSGVNIFISIAALIVGAAQILFLVNFVWSLWKGPKAEKNPWKATTLEWQAESPPPHGNWGPQLPTVYRWAYDYSRPDATEDFVPQTVPVVGAPAGTDGGKH
ncbi:MAG: cbb3-type cytochrome c oxidase subunit I [Armatimonadetes bacterium]|nr:cbb3-type cytochrome c oxidase subunit I [Armatimonadota bacterium]MDW8121815.1 cbb3-type cytochrome c oxidase subunit I [Armatimonadota bacterium]